MESKKKNILIFTFIFVAVLLTVNIIFNAFVEKKVEKVSYNEFIDMANNNKIEQIEQKSRKDRLIATLKNGEKISFPNPSYPTFKKDMLEKNIIVKDDTFGLKNNMDIGLILILFFIYLVASSKKDIDIFDVTICAILLYNIIW